MNHEVTKKSQSSSLLDRVCLWLATCGGVGFSPVAPGTLGALLGLPLTLLLVSRFTPSMQPLVALVLFVAGISFCDRAAKILGRDDPSAVIWDELATVPIVFWFVPTDQLNLWVLLVGFALHRLFDISKFPPAKQAERIHGGLGIMLDDLVAAGYSCACLHAILWWF